MERSRGKMLKIPKNVMQIGTGSPNVKLYMEDYVHTFLTSVRYKKHNKIHCISFRALLNYFLVDTKISAEYTKGVVLKMSKLSLAGEWKLRGEFMDVTADRYAEVLAHLNAMPPKPTIPGYLTEENMTEEERKLYLKEPDPKFTVNTALAMILVSTKK